MSDRKLAIENIKSALRMGLITIEQSMVMLKKISQNDLWTTTETSLGEIVQLRDVPKKGIFYVIPQYQEENFFKNFPNVDVPEWQEKKEFTIWHGHVTFYLTISGQLLKVAYYYDGRG